MDLVQYFNSTYGKFEHIRNEEWKFRYSGSCLWPHHGEPFDWRKEKEKDIKRGGTYLGNFEWAD